MCFLANIEASDWIAISSVIVALCALGISIWQGFLSRQHAHLSARPIIESNFNNHGSVGLEIYNAGLGPAVLTSFKAIYKQQEFDMFRGSELEKLVDLLVENRSDLPLMTFSFRIPSNHSAIAPGDVVKLLTITCDWDVIVQRMRRAFSQIELKITYQDIYGKTFDCHHVSGVNA